MAVTPEEAIETLDEALSALTETMKAATRPRRAQLWTRVNRLLDNRLKMMGKRDEDNKV